MLRIVAVADTHTFERDLGPLPEADVLVHAGDMLRFGTLEELEPVADWIRGEPHRHKIVVAGNHDWCFARPEERTAALEMLGDDVVYLEDEATEIDGVIFHGSPWQPEFFDWAFNLPRGQPLEEKWALIPAKVDVLVTHGPPLGFGDRSAFAGRQGCADLMKAVRRVSPLLHLFGHIHEDGGAWRDAETLIANVTTSECSRAASVFDVDVRGQCALEVAVPPGRASTPPGS